MGHPDGRRQRLTIAKCVTKPGERSIAVAAPLEAAMKMVPDEL
jgi:hypothetical protein